MVIAGRAQRSSASNSLRSGYKSIVSVSALGTPRAAAQMISDATSVAPHIPMQVLFTIVSPYALAASNQSCLIQDDRNPSVNSISPSPASSRNRSKSSRQSPPSAFSTRKLST